MAEYVNITKDYVERTLENYFDYKDNLKYSFTAGISVLQAISIAIVDEKKSDLELKEKPLFNKITEHHDAQKLRDITFFRTAASDWECFENIRNGLSHFVENYQYINQDVDLKKFRFTCNNMKSQNTFSDIEEHELNKFLEIIYAIIK